MTKQPTMEPPTRTASWSTPYRGKQWEALTRGERVTQFLSADGCAKQRHDEHHE